jgi:OHCU decarboxylase
MTTPTLTLAQVNALDHPAFVAALVHLFEGPPWIVKTAWDARPFTTLDNLQNNLVAVMYAAPVERKVELIQAHPDLVGRAALAGTLTPASTSEQAAAELDQLSPGEIATFTRLNAEYRERFGFPFVICARENKRESILAGFAQRMSHTRDEEIATALAEIAKICRLRLLDTVRADDV